MTAKLRLSLSADAAGALTIAINRTDVAPGEPAALQNFVELQPGDAITLPLHPRCLITIAEGT